MDELPMFPLGSVLLPGERLPLQVFEPRYVALVQACLAADDPIFGVVLISQGHEVGGGDRRTGIGTIARIEGCTRFPGDKFGLDCVGTERIRVREWLPDDPYPRAMIERWPDDASVRNDDDDEVEFAQLRSGRVRDLQRRLAEKLGARLIERDDVGELPSDPSERSFALAADLPLGDTDRQRILAATGPSDRIDALNDALDDVIAALEFRLQ